ncbi:ATP-binding protein [Niabella yanshanensis]|uniref:ATP-binding protein n=1 Tax=Niabella yanshanensis TaxID=577386 RepID=A0ABZ0W847_9BACT|nr:ATP-binding protein [Niabella yanshanensis]WQD38667.1 ATP-binding protein [Niabella yanshanensis]
MIERAILQSAKESLNQFRALCVTGPRQSGKTTLSRLLCPDKAYFNFESPATEHQVLKNIENFLNQNKRGAILDEVQRVPELLRYLQTVLDKSTKRGQFILTGSNNFLLQEQISQSLAGRAGYISLLPLSYAELKDAQLAEDNFLKHILNGGYPEIWQEKLKPEIWMNSYIQTYVQRDVRLLKNINNLAAFNRFLFLCANYAGQILNREELAKQVGVDTKTILSWLGVLESSYVIFLLQPWYNNLNKRILKSPKLYFHDTGLLCRLLGIPNITHLKKHNAYGALFENWIISEIKKNNTNQGLSGEMYYFRDSAGNEIDLVYEKDGQPLAIEIKAAHATNASMFSGIRYWQKNNFYHKQSMLVYGGNKTEPLNEHTSIISWRDIGDI